MKEMIQQRQNLLKLLYDARLNETQIQQGYVTINDLTDAVGNCTFNLGVLQELNHVDRQGYKVRITGQGVLALEQMA